jgi:solute carrier family 50 (sugar transporter)
MTAGASILLNYVCPILGCVMATCTFAAPIRDLRLALQRKSLGSLDPFPFVAMTGNCLGWVAYSCLTLDFFVLVSNLPGLILSLWLNFGAAKLQYFQLTSVERIALVAPRDSHATRTAEEAENNNDMDDGLWRDASPMLPEVDANGDVVADDRSAQAIEQSPDPSVAATDSMEDLVMVPQERALITIVILWSIIIVYVGWILPMGTANSNKTASHIVGVVVNVNLVFFYGAPLKAAKKVIATADSSSIHVPTMLMMCANSLFWFAYGCSRRDFIIILPNGMGKYAKRKEET